MQGPSVTIPSLLLDACALINFAASRRFDELALVHGGFVLVDLVAEEAHFVRKGGPGEDASDREEIDLEPLIGAGRLTIVSAATDQELNSFIQFATVLGDGESMTLAVALHRRFGVVTDDRKASRIAASNGIKVLTTLDVLRAWEQSACPSQSEVRAALVDLQERGCYVPHRSHPLRSWWEERMGAE